jgi:hypothetical protein
VLTGLSGAGVTISTNEQNGPGGNIELRTGPDLPDDIILRGNTGQQIAVLSTATTTWEGLFSVSQFQFTAEGVPVSSIAELTGATGPQGPDGPQGPQGPSGPSGGGGVTIDDVIALAIAL